jgi:hypothetical protein
MSEVFTFRRLVLLLRNDIIGRYRTLLLHSAVLAATILVGSLLRNGFNGGPEPEGDFYFYAFPALLFGWGTIVASGAFRELHDKSKNEAYLLLPASDVEKTIARLLPVLGFFVYLLVYLTVVSWVVETVSLLLFGSRDRLFNPFDPRVSLFIGHYVVAQSVFFVGAAWFRKAHFWKTSLTITATLLGFAALAALLSWALFDPYFGGLNEPEMYQIYLANIPLVDGAALVAKAGYFLVLPPLCWFVAWLRVKETQVSHGV